MPVKYAFTSQKIRLLIKFTIQNQFIMKKILTLLFLFIGFASVKSQGLTITPLDSIYITAIDSSEFSTINGLIFLHNNLTDSITVKWRLSSDTIPTGWAILFCDNQNCYNLPTPPKTSLPVAPGDSIDMHAEFSPACVGGVGTMRIAAAIQVRDTTIATYTFTYTANITSACVTAVANVSAKAQVSVFPNPASTQVSISGLSVNHQVAIQVIDLAGRIISIENKVAGELTNVNIASLPAGLYILKTTDAQNNEISIGKFSKF